MKLPRELLQQCWFLVGPTAVGKSELALRVAERHDAEILSLDSMAIYRGMDVGTAKPTPEQQARVPHHLIDLAEPHEEFSTARYLQQAEAACLNVLERGRRPLFVGGTGLYLRAVLRGVFEGPAADWEFRRELEAEAAQRPAGWLHAELQAVDLESARRLHPHDTRRLVRALEIHHVTGTPASRLQREQPLPEEQRPRHVYWLHPERAWLYARIDRRVERMFEAGLEEEVRRLHQLSPPIGRTAKQALGYREVIDWLEGRIETREETVELIQTRTRQFAKRQYTWFRNLDECREVPFAAESSTEPVLRLFDDG
jgi:tRNA dimethylallyltransferase